jgi:penicillin-binding protein 2
MLIYYFTFMFLLLISIITLILIKWMIYVYNISIRVIYGVEPLMRKKRFVAIYAFLLLVMCGMLVRLYYLSNINNDIAQTVDTHGTYSIKLATQRGTIYDTNMLPITNQNIQFIAAISPAKNPAPQLAALIPNVFDEQSVLTRMQQGNPFAVKVKSQDIKSDGITVVSVKQRYSDTPLASNIIGYLDSEGNGVAGIEKAYNDVLKKDGGDLTAIFKVDAMGRTLQGLPCAVSNTTGSVNSGVVLTLDKRIQEYTQQAATKYLKSGAAIVMDPYTGDILSAVSVPYFSQNNLSQSINATNSPMLNRIFSSYDLGSTFKICLTAEALETGINPAMTVDCTGKIDVSGKVFNCEKLTGHGVLNMAAALSASCNIYYITLGQMLGGDKILSMASKLGFGQTQSLAPGLTPSAGVLPTANALKIPAALANFSIGQGEFMATPIQVARMLSAVVNDGKLPTPRLVKGFVDENKNFTSQNNTVTPEQVFSSSTAKQIQQFLIQTVDVGTGTPAKPAVGGAGGKTSTAQSGWLKNGKIINEAWFAGFYPADNPKYVIVVIAEDGKSGGASAGPVFKSIADNLAQYCNF